MKALQELPRRLLIALVTFYRLLISPMLAPTCRYWPSCSEYALEALRGHGAMQGGWLVTRRICRCHPWAAGGIDLVPTPGHRSGPASSPDSSPASSPASGPFVRASHSSQRGPGCDPSDSSLP